MSCFFRAIAELAETFADMFSLEAELEALAARTGDLAGDMTGNLRV